MALPFYSKTDHWLSEETSNVLGLNVELTMKVGYGIDTNYIQTLDYIKQQAPHTPIPETHGILQQSNSKRVFLFMSRLPGEPLDSKWRLLSADQETSVKVQLGAIVEDFRSLPAPAEEVDAVLGGANLVSVKTREGTFALQQDP